MYHMETERTELVRVTQLEAVKKLFDQLGIGYEACIGFDGDRHVQTVELLADRDHSKIRGYSGFVAMFNFTMDDEFIDVGIWE